MKNLILSRLVCAAGLILMVGISFPTHAQDRKFIEGQALTVIGKFHEEKGYARFPAGYEGKLRPEVWGIGQRSTGMSILFETNSSEIVARWTLSGGYSPAYTSTTGARGVDLYIEVDGIWRFIMSLLCLS